MALRRPSWSLACLCHRNSWRAAVARVELPSRARRSGWVKSGVAVERTRHLATFTDVGVDEGVDPGTAIWGEQDYETAFDDLLVAIQRKDVRSTTEAFLRWTSGLEVNPHHERIHHFHSIPSPVISEIIRSLDPVRRPEVDIAHTLNISQGSTIFTDAGKFMDEFGVRVHHRRVRHGILTLLRLRKESYFPLRAADFEVLLRMVGASVDYRLSAIMFGEMKAYGLANERTAKTWLEFLKARFMTDPVYYHYDRARMILARRAPNLRDLPTHEARVSMAREKDRVRFSMNAFKRQHWGRKRDEPEEDLHALFRRSGEDYRSFWLHWVRTNLMGHDLDVEFLAVSIEGFARSGNWELIVENILRDCYGIVVDEENQTVSGGFDIAQDSPLYPTGRLQDAIVDAFGSMKEISLAMQLIDFISQRYDVPISAKTWSNLLNWTYVCASETSKLAPEARATPIMPTILATDVMHVWNAMTSPPYNIEPSFEDLVVYAKTLLHLGALDKAVDMIRTTAAPYLQSVSDEFEEALKDEVLLHDLVADQPPFTSSPYSSSTESTLQAARTRRHQAEAHKDYVTNAMSTLLDNILRQASTARLVRCSPFTTTTIPNLLRDFSHLFLAGIRYRTATGTVRIYNSAQDTFRFEPPVSVARNTLKQKWESYSFSTGRMDAHGHRRTVYDPELKRDVPNPDFEWPTNHDMKIVERIRLPRARSTHIGAPLKDDAAMSDKAGFWANIQRQMMY